MARKAKAISQGFCSVEPMKVFTDVWSGFILFILLLMGCGCLLLRALKLRN
jgi:hypothetical protein